MMRTLASSIARVLVGAAVLGALAPPNLGCATAVGSSSDGGGSSSEGSGTGGEGGEGGAGTATGSGTGTGTATGTGTGGSGGGGAGGAGVGGAGGGAPTSGDPELTTLHVLRVGTGAAALDASATAVFVEKRTLQGALVGSPIALPVAKSGANEPLTIAGNRPLEGSLSRSADGQFVVVAGYAAAPGLASVAGTSAATVKRVIGRVDASGAVATSTVLATAFEANSPRGVATVDGSSYWACGTGSPASTGGAHFIAHGTTGGTQILANPSNARQCHVFWGQLYGSSGAGAFVNVFAIGSGVPSAPGQIATSLPGMPTVGAAPVAFALLDRNASVPGPDTLYVADEGSLPGGGVQKWTYGGSAWTLVATFTDGLTSGVRGLAAGVTGQQVTVVAVTGGSTAGPTSLVAYVDDGSANPPGVVLATSGANTAFRSVAVSPVAAP